MVSTGDLIAVCRLSAAGGGAGSETVGMPEAGGCGSGNGGPAFAAAHDMSTAIMHAVTHDVMAVLHEIWFMVNLLIKNEPQGTQSITRVRT
jgi:hypothetical protein